MTIRSRAAMGICLACMPLGLGDPQPRADEPRRGSEPGRLRDTILVLDDQFWEAASRHDVETLSRLFADDYYGIGNDGTRWTKATILEQHRTARLGDLKRTSEREVIRVGDHAVLLTYDARFNVFTKEGVLRDKAHQRLLSCWVQRDGGWFVRFSQATDLAGPASQAEPIGQPVDRQKTNPERSKEENQQEKPGTGKKTVISLRDVIVDEVDADQNTITVTIGRNDTPGGEGKGINDQKGKVATGERRISTRLVNLPVTKDAHIRISSRRFPSVSNNVQRGFQNCNRGCPPPWN